MRSQYISKLEEADEVVVYGTGAVSDVLLCQMEILGMKEKITAFAVSNICGIVSKKRGYPILSIDRAVFLYGGALVIVAAQSVNHADMEKNLKRVGCTNYCFTDPGQMISDFYRMLYRHPIDKGKILFMNYNGCGYGCNPKYIAEELLRRKGIPKLQMIWGVKEHQPSIPEEIRQVKIGTLEYYRELSTAGIWIDNARKSIDVKKREGQYYIQTWHGAAPMKKVEKDIENHMSLSLINACKNDSDMADIFVSGSKFYTSLYKNSFWYDGEIIEVGLPRQDVFWNSKSVRNKVLNRYRLDKNALLVLYAPTFRDDFSLNACDLDIREVKGAIEGKYNRKSVLLISKHPNVRNKEYGFASDDFIDVSDYEDFEELLAATDILISDYSGCVYDFSAFTHRPVFLYQKDYRKMHEQRGFYVAFDNMPYPRAESTNDLIREISDFDYEKYHDELCTFVDQFGNFDDGHASEKVCDRIEALLGAGNNE